MIHAENAHLIKARAAGRGREQPDDAEADEILTDAGIPSSPTSSPTRAASSSPTTSGSRTSSTSAGTSARSTTSSARRCAAPTARSPPAPRDDDVPMRVAAFRARDRAGPRRGADARLHLERASPGPPTCDSAARGPQPALRRLAPGQAGYHSRMSSGLGCLVPGVSRQAAGSFPSGWPGSCSLIGTAAPYFTPRCNNGWCPEGGRCPRRRRPHRPPRAPCRRPRKRQAARAAHLDALVDLEPPGAGRART